MYKSIHTGKQIDDGIGRTKWLSNPNLLDNAYFGNPVDQRGGYVTTPETKAYRDVGLTNYAGPAYTVFSVIRVNDSVGYYVPGDGNTWYVSLSDCVRGYTGAGYTIDRWNSLTVNTNLLVTDNGIKLISSGTRIGVIRQLIENPSRFYGKTVTVSALLDSGECVWATGIIPETPPSADFGIYAFFDGNASGRYVVVYVFADGTIGVQLKVPANGEMEVVAAKLELGTEQTLAHQDENGNWVLNEIPNYAEELAKCQRYQLAMPYGIGAALSTTVSDGNGNCIFPVCAPTTMRAMPVLTYTGTLRVHGHGINYSDATASVAILQGNCIGLSVNGLTPLTAYTIDSATGGVLLFDANL